MIEAAVMRRIAFIAFICAVLVSCNGGGECSFVEESGTANAVAGPIYVATGDPFQAGPLAVRTIDVEQCDGGAPRPLHIVAPDAPGTFAVVQLQHAFFGMNTWYDEIMRHLASHGFVVVAPQMYELGAGVALGNPSADQEAESANQVREWLGEHLGEVAGVDADMGRFGLAGHSRGGKVVWLLLKADPSRGMAVAGIDPVDGTGGPLGGQSRVLAGTLNFPFPSLVIGTGRGGACAPAGDNHMQFYAASASPAWHVVASDYGHGDMLDEDAANAAALVCDSKSDREPMRRLTAGMLTAFFRATLQGDAAAFASLSDVAAAPAAIVVESK